MVGRPARLPDRTTAVTAGGRRRRACAGSTSGGALPATLAPTAGEDRPARAGAHPQPEAVGLGPPAVVRLERALAHEVLPLHDIDGAHPSADERAGGNGANGWKAAAPVPPEAGSCWPARARAPCGEQGERAEPAADSDQHSRGRAAAGDRPEPDRSWSTHGWRRPRRRAEATRPQRSARTGGSSPGCG